MGDHPAGQGRFPHSARNGSILRLALFEERIPAYRPDGIELYLPKKEASYKVEYVDEQRTADSLSRWQSRKEG